MSVSGSANFQNLIRQPGFLNQAHAWLLEIAFVREVSMRVYVCVCVRACVCGYSLT